MRPFVSETMKPTDGIHFEINSLNPNSERKQIANEVIQNVYSVQVTTCALEK